MRTTARAIAIVLVLAAPQLVSAQWIRHRTAGVPRLADGTPNLKAPAPRTADGHPDFSGVWLTGNPVPCRKETGSDFLECGIELPIAKEGINFGLELPGGLPYQPSAAAIVKKRTAESAKDDPHARCPTIRRLRGMATRQENGQATGSWCRQSASATTSGSI